MAYSREEAAGLVIRAGLALIEKGLIARTWGNISARISDTEFLITPSGMAYETLTPEKLVVCKIEDCSYEGSIKPSSEKGIHGEAYKYRPDVNFIIHTHQLNATAVGVIGEMVKGSNEEEKKILGESTPVAAYGISSTKKLKKKVSECIQQNPKSNAFFMRYHGALCLGRDYDHAFEVAETLERICEEIVCASEILKETAPAPFDVVADEKVLREEIKKATGFSEVLFDQSSAAVLCSQRGRAIRPMIDDMAQIAGTGLPCISPSDKEALQKLVQALKKSPAVFVKGAGAVIAAADASEAQAVQIVLDKNCLAALYAAAWNMNVHLKWADAKLQRIVYLKKYSKLKNR